MAKELKPGKFLKSRIKKEYESEFTGCSSYFVTNYGGLTNKEIERLKNNLRSASAKYIVVKNSLCRSVVDELKLEGLSGLIGGSCAISYTDKDPVAVSKALVDFLKSNEKFKLIGGFIDGKVTDVEVLKDLAAMPSREVLLGRLLSAMNSPVSGLVTVCSSIIKKFVYAVDAIKRKKEENKEE
jgi:large subunit ribosomal protein L10